MEALCNTNCVDTDLEHRCCDALGNMGVETDGKWIPLSTVGVVSIRDGLTCALVTKGFRRPLQVPSAMRKVVTGAIERWKQGRLESTEDIVTFLRGQIKENPIGVLQLLWWKAKRAWYGTDAQRPTERWILLLQVPYLLLALWGSWLLWCKGVT